MAAVAVVDRDKAVTRAAISNKEDIKLSCAVALTRPHTHLINQKQYDFFVLLHLLASNINSSYLHPFCFSQLLSSR